MVGVFRVPLVLKTVRPSGILINALMDVPSRIDFQNLEEAEEWARTANIKRPFREDFFRRIVEELRDLNPRPLSILELGSGPGFLAERVLLEIDEVTYTLLDISPAMHELARRRLGKDGRCAFVIKDFRSEGWAANLGCFDAVLTMQAVHEVRHRSRVGALHREVGSLLNKDGIYLVCDHVLRVGGMTNAELYMTASEQEDALRLAGFSDVERLMEENGLVLHRARKGS